MGTRCAMLPYLRAISQEREWRGLTPSRAGTGPRKIVLEQKTDFAIDPDKRAWAMFGIGVHGKLSMHKYTYNVLSEEPLEDEKIRGIPDVLEEDEYMDGRYVLTDLKTWGSFKVTKGLGIIKEIEYLRDPQTGGLLYFKTGKRKGQPKTRQKLVVDANKIDMRAEEFQLNCYRILFEKYGFPINKLWIMVICRDGGTQIAFSRGIMRNTYMIPVRRLPDKEVLDFYAKLRLEVEKGLENWPCHIRKCNAFESWDGRRCKPDLCEVWLACQKLDKRSEGK